MMEALWVHQWHNRVNETLLTRMLRSSDPWARAAATRVLCYWRDRVANPLALLKVQANDAHPGRAARGRPRGELLPDARGGRRRAGLAEPPAGSVPRLHARPDDEDADVARSRERNDERGQPARRQRPGGSAARSVRRGHAPRPPRQGRADHSDRHDSRADALRRALVRGRGRQAGAAGAHQSRRHAPQHRHRPARLDQGDRRRGSDDDAAGRSQRAWRMCRTVRWCSRRPGW